MMTPKDKHKGRGMQEHGGLVEFINAIPPAVQGAIMAVVMAVLRVYYDAEETSAARAALEASICGALTLASASALDWAGAPQQVAVAVGGAVGFVGVAKLREFLFTWINRRSSGGTDSDPT
jgi:lambda family phage holin